MLSATQSTHAGPLRYPAALQQRHEAATSADARKERGQVFTPPSVCRFMAGLLTRIPDRCRVLDAGAGVGSLAAAVCERVLTLRSPRQVEIVLYETDGTLLPLLEENMRHCREALNTAGHELRYMIHGQDFILSFAPGAAVVYVGDIAKKHVTFERDQLAGLGLPITEHDKLPDVVLYDAKKRWLFMIEAVTSHGPVSPKRHREIESFLANCQAERVYVTAFLSISDFRKYAADIAWETEIWIAATPDHMIHFNGPKFLGQYNPPRTGYTSRGHE